MTGMKEGAGEDPFAEDEEPTASGSADRPDREVTQVARDRTAETNGTNDSRPPKQQRTARIPYKLRRSGVQDGRSRVPLFLQKDTKSAERKALRELEERFDENVSLTDLREALVKVGLGRLDEVEDHLEAWGYGMTFDE